MNDRACVVDDRDELAARYVAARLEGHELEDFELHLLSCAECRTAVREAAGMRGALRQRARPRPARFMLPAAAVAGAAMLVLWVNRYPLHQLGAVDAPSLRGIVAVRAPQESAAIFAERGVAAYQQKRYAAASDLFARAYH